MKRLLFLVVLLPVLCLAQSAKPKVQEKTTAAKSEPTFEEFTSTKNTYYTIDEYRIGDVGYSSDNNFDVCVRQVSSKNATSYYIVIDAGRKGSLCISRVEAQSISANIAKVKEESKLPSPSGAKRTFLYESPSALTIIHSTDWSVMINGTLILDSPIISRFETCLKDAISKIDALSK